MSECSLWRGPLCKKGYPETKIHQKNVRAHRYIWEFVNGRKLKPWPEEVVMHTCDNPACVNPEHLVAGTQSENIQDMYRKGRGHSPSKFKYSKACKQGHPWTEQSSYFDARGEKSCRICRTNRANAWHAKKRAAA